MLIFYCFFKKIKTIKKNKEFFISENHALIFRFHALISCFHTLNLWLSARFRFFKKVWKFKKKNKNFKKDENSFRQKTCRFTILFQVPACSEVIGLVLAHCQSWLETEQTSFTWIVRDRHSRAAKPCSCQLVLEVSSSNLVLCRESLKLLSCHLVVSTP